MAMMGSGAAMAAQAMSKSGKPMTAQQQRMVNCNKEATGKKGAERKSFMSTCLKGKTAAAPMTSNAKMAQREKMKSCNAEAKTKSLKGADRKSFMKTCLSNGAPAH
ncbi:MAG: PsiF family protein [Rhodanobacteraceae bacterium]